MGIPEEDLKPNIAQMLTIAKGCDLSTLEEAYQMYLNHYDCFFLIEKFQEQSQWLAAELFKLGFVDANTGLLIDISIDECMGKLGIKYEEPIYEEQPIMEEECLLDNW